MPKALSLQGRRFGHLLVVGKADIKIKRNICWVCKCDCGREIIVRGTYLTSGHTHSCGCTHYGNRAKKFNFKGGLYTAKEICQMLKVTPTTIYRYAKGNTFDYDAYKQCHRGVWYNGEYLSFAEISKIAGVSRQTIYDRYKRGWQEAELLSERIAQQRRTSGNN